MKSMTGIKQPLLGILGTILTVGLALAICVQFDGATLTGWVGLVVMSSIPAQIVIIAVWQGSYPAVLATMGQPAKGVAILGMMAVAAAVIAPGILALAGGGVMPPTPFATMFTVISVCTSFWVVPLLQCWPLTAVAKHPVGLGLGVLVLTYLSAWLVWQLGFDFTAMKDAPFYLASLDPHGAVAAWPIFTFIVTASLVIIGLVMFDYWPVTALAAAVPVLGRQPWRAVVSVVLVLAVSEAIWAFCVKALGMDVVDYLVRVPVSGLFGQLIMLHMMQTAPLQGTPQPVKGLIMMAVVVLLAMASYPLYASVALALVGPMASGAPGYQLDIWIATAMLSVTFPIFVTFGDGFGFWPLLRPAAAAGQVEKQVGLKAEG
jgi:hypothetical protein